jgi:hypothetical protein
MPTHTGEECPTRPDAWVWYDLGDGELYVGRADELYWGPGDDELGRPGRILQYEVIALPSWMRPAAAA